MAEPLLQMEGLTRRFGALAAVNGVSLSVAAGTVHAVIGPNGAGKSTLVNLLSGELRATAGRVFFRGQDVTRAPPDRLSRLGVGRSYQTVNLFGGLTCHGSVWLAAQSRLPSSMRFFRPAAGNPEIAARVDRALQLCGLGHRAHDVAARLSYGEQRQLELGMVLATEPTLLLLDEPLAGLGHDEAARVVDLLRRIARDHTLVLIEHDMDAVFSVAQAVTVLLDGKVLQSGTPEEIRRSRAVIEAYLGEDAP